MARKISGSIPVPPLTDEMYERGKKTIVHTPVDVIAASFDRKADVLQLTLRNGIVIRFPRSEIRELAAADAKKISKVDVQVGGDGISFESLDVDIYVPGLIADELSTAFAKASGRKSAGRSSALKASASRKNGEKGGRPRKERAA